MPQYPVRPVPHPSACSAPLQAHLAPRRGVQVVVVVMVMVVVVVVAAQGGVARGGVGGGGGVGRAPAPAGEVETGQEGRA